MLDDPVGNAAHVPADARRIHVHAAEELRRRAVGGRCGPWRAGPVLKISWPRLLRLLRNP